MRLIDADKFNGKVIASHAGNGVIKLVAIDDVPTAYDPDKVVEQLKDRSTLSRPVGWTKPYEIITLKDAVEEAAHIWLKVTDVRVERLQEITEDEAKEEGAIDNRGFIHSPNNEYDRIHTAREHFIETWNSTIKKSDLDRYGWDANPYVFVIEFVKIDKPEEIQNA